MLDIAVVGLDESAASATLTVPGHRICEDLRPRLELKIVSLADDAQVWRALPPAADIALLSDETTFTRTLQLPVRGQPILSSFDDDELSLGLAGTVEDARTVVRLTGAVTANPPPLATAPPMIRTHSSACNGSSSIARTIWRS